MFALLGKILLDKSLNHSRDSARFYTFQSFTFSLENKSISQKSHNIIELNTQQQINSR